MKPLRSRELAISEIAPFGNIDLGVAVRHFPLMGFLPGDAVDVEFSNGFAFRNIPVFSGFYGRGGMPCLYVTASLYPNVGIGYPVSGNPWLVAGLAPGDTARVVLRRRRGFSQLEERMRLPELLRPAPTRSPQQNANWRSLPGEGIAPGTIYRSCSPIRDDFAGAATACALMEQVGIRSVLNLSDNGALLQASRERADAHAAPYLRLCDDGRVLPLHLSVDLSLRENARTLAAGLLWLAGQPRPSLIHCKLGLDRTGAVCVLLEMLAGCGYADIERDYQTSYLNLFGPPERGRGYALCNQRLGELLDLLLSFGVGAQGPEGDSLAAAGTREGWGDAQGVARQRPSGAALHRAARGYLAFGGLSEGQIDLVEQMLRSEHDAREEAPR